MEFRRQLPEDKNLIVQYESLGGLTKTYVAQNKVLVLDEVESIFNQISSSINTGSHKYGTRTNNVLESIKNLLELIRVTPVVIVLDANLSEFAKQFITSIGYTPQLLTYDYINMYKPNFEHEYQMIRHKSEWFNQLYSAITEGKRVVIPITSANKASELNRYITEKFPTKSVGFYSASHGSKSDFNNVNEVFVGYDVLIYTPTLTAGVSFDAFHFDEMFCWFDPYSCNADTCV